MSKVIVVGGGPSGMMAALSASKNNNEVILIERNGELGRKLRATGGGRCNFTNNREIEDFFDKVVNNKKFLYSSFYTFTNKNLISYLESKNLEYKIEEENDHKVYTKNDKSIEVIELLNKDLINHNVKIMYNKKVVDIITEEITEQDDHNNNKTNYSIKGVILDNGDKILGDKVIISTGGVSYSKTGSDGSMYKVLQNHGHTLNKLYPALAPLTIEEKWIKALQGISMRNVEISCKIKKKKISKSGDMLFAHFGITGPCVLIISSYINKIIEKDKIELNIDFLPNLDVNEISNIIREFPNKNILNNLKQILPQNFLKEILSILSLSDKKANDLSKADEIKIIEYIKNMKLTCNGTTGINTGMVTSGGISVKEINSSTMESKLIKDLFFTGEVIDVDAETGGYNLQIAFSTGYLAGISV
ncbi:MULTISPECIES: NAD(P)/FAD-dependent oxidoreductase [unclassified Clostridioides]|uniref:NAD(P)/FAD-dependent oxidoreductase n=1 Tax=unclassified Clostridioides TaxID=2635829 RepID=UPI001D0C682A|nr:NAD(P)/FAD-dependent oxidoreductase [Clostridioides sp. ES-S-0049-03]MCC0674918.1 NAD(P)/FAD-dependent oxidoreductase [Clostridioides sp. ES-W-0018-02]MCC0697150.1 NAD(P)/FAD-dependent oxidoreductase [Clostridioides sp. ES-S-0048-02]MCC0710268.1 NAD(P)/FAD-dependent oxidoreductase [Clostridioides sp. ES-W-0017-02]MCC0764349.1 NAD(P)/FAD-dependent oxidoreductase [Clostridioides sp. ES-S-0006-03]